MRREPVAVGGIVSILAALGAIWGLDLSETELSGAVATVLAVVAFLQRRRVSPVD